MARSCPGCRATRPASGRPPTRPRRSSWQQDGRADRTGCASAASCRWRWNCSRTTTPRGQSSPPASRPSCARGLDVTVRTLPAGTLLRDHIDTREYDLLLFAWQADVNPDPFGGWHTSQITSGGRNVAGFHDARSDALLEQARFTMDTDERSALYGQGNARFMELAPSIVLAYPRGLYVQPARSQAPRTACSSH